MKVELELADELVEELYRKSKAWDLPLATCVAAGRTVDRQEVEAWHHSRLD